MPVLTVVYVYMTTIALQQESRKSPVADKRLKAFKEALDRVKPKEAKRDYGIPSSTWHAWKNDPEAALRNLKPESEARVKALLSGTPIRLSRQSAPGPNGMSLRQKADAWDSVVKLVDSHRPVVLTPVEVVDAEGQRVLQMREGRELDQPPEPPATGTGDSGPP